MLFSLGSSIYFSFTLCLLYYQRVEPTMIWCPVLSKPVFRYLYILLYTCLHVSLPMQGKIYSDVNFVSVFNINLAALYLQLKFCYSQGGLAKVTHGQAEGKSSKWCCWSYTMPFCIDVSSLHFYITNNQSWPEVQLGWLALWHRAHLFIDTFMVFFNFWSGPVSENPPTPLQKGA